MRGFMLSFPVLQSSASIPFEPGSMLWVIQRDFLQGKSVQQLVHDALAPVPNPQHDKAIEETNSIRASLSSIAKNSTGFRCVEAMADGFTDFKLQNSVAACTTLKLACPHGNQQTQRLLCEIVLCQHVHPFHTFTFQCPFAGQSFQA